MSGGLRSIAVLGSGMVALSAAVAFGKALPNAKITLLRTKPHPGALADRFPLVTSAGLSLLERIGLGEERLYRTGAAMPRLAQRFASWGEEERPWLVGEGEPLSLPGAALLHQRWLELVRTGSMMPFHALVPSAVLALASRDDLARHVEHALRLDPHLAGAMLEGNADALLVERVDCQRFEVERTGLCVKALHLPDGTRVSADLFIDASGPGAALDQCVPYADWSRALPCDRLLLARADDIAVHSLDDYEADDEGWRASWPWPRGGVRAVGFSSRVLDEEAARRSFGFTEDASLVRVAPGRRQAFWVGNVLRIGEAAAQVGPLGLAGFSLAVAHLELALELLPGRDMQPLLVDEYNRRAVVRVDRLRDFLAAIHLAVGMGKGRFWREVRESAVPIELEQRIALFERNGHMPHFEEESVGPDAWRSVFLGQGIRPSRPDPIAMAEGERERASALAGAAERLAAAAALGMKVFSGAPR